MRLFCKVSGIKSNFPDCVFHRLIPYVVKVNSGSSFLYSVVSPIEMMVLRMQGAVSFPIVEKLCTVVSEFLSICFMGIESWSFFYYESICSIKTISSIVAGANGVRATLASARYIIYT